MPRDRDEQMVSVPLSFLTETQETATKAAASGAKVAVSLARLADQWPRQEAALARALALAEDVVDARVAAARKEGFDAGLAQGRSEAPASRAFGEAVAAMWADPWVRKALIALAVATLAMGTGYFTHVTTLLGVVGAP